MEERRALLSGRRQARYDAGPEPLGAGPARRLSLRTFVTGLGLCAAAAALRTTQHSRGALAALDLAAREPRAEPRHIRRCLRGDASHEANSVDQGDRREAGDTSSTKARHAMSIFT